MASCLVHTADESVTLSAATVKRLLDRGDGDAALLYLALLRHHGTVPPRSLAGELRWDRGRIEAAEAVLRELGLVAPAGRRPPPRRRSGPSTSGPKWRSGWRRAVSSRPWSGRWSGSWARSSPPPDVGVLLGLTDYLGLPADVIYLLVCHCAERVARRYGPGRRPTMRQIEREGYAWARRGIDTQAGAAAYLRQYAQRQEPLPAYMRALQLGDRPPPRRRRSISSPGRRWAFRRRRWPWPTTRPC